MAKCNILPKIRFPQKVGVLPLGVKLILTPSRYGIRKKGGLPWRSIVTPLAYTTITPNPSTLPSQTEAELFYLRCFAHKAPLQRRYSPLRLDGGAEHHLPIRCFAPPSMDVYGGLLSSKAPSAKQGTGRG